MQKVDSLGMKIINNCDWQRAETGKLVGWTRFFEFQPDISESVTTYTSTISISIFPFLLYNRSISKMSIDNKSHVYF